MRDASGKAELFRTPTGEARRASLSKAPEEHRWAKRPKSTVGKEPEVHESATHGVGLLNLDPHRRALVRSQRNA